MKMLPLFVTAAVLLAAGVQGQSLQFINVNDPGIYDRFSAGGHVAATQASSSFSPTNLAVTAILQSRSFPGSTLNASGTYGYEYRVILRNDGEYGTNVFTVSSVAVNFNAPEYFAFGQHASNQVWVVTHGGPGTVGPASASFSGTNVVFSFDPPLMLATLTNRSVDTYYFGIVSTNRPRVTTAILTGAIRTPDCATNFVGEVQARTP